VNEVPIIRIYGSTPAGQKTCLHVHRVRSFICLICPKKFWVFFQLMLSKSFDQLICSTRNRHFKAYVVIRSFPEQFCASSLVMWREEHKRKEFYFPLLLCSLVVNQAWCQVKFTFIKHL
jgi:hypothetical protein